MLINPNFGFPQVVWLESADLLLDGRGHIYAETDREVILSRIHAQRLLTPSDIGVRDNLTLPSE